MDFRVENLKAHLKILPLIKCFGFLDELLC